jgi:hypothetical protein
MAKVPGLKLEINEVSQTIDFDEVFDADLSDNRELRLAIGQAIIERILERTEEGRDIHGNRFAAYDKDYVKSLTFRAHNKSEGEINMTLKGDMLAQIDIIEEDANAIKIGWDDDTENAKAYNHNTGDTVKKRQFFGVTAGELAQIQKEFASELVKHSYAQEQEQQKKTVLDIVAGLEWFSGGDSPEKKSILRKLTGIFFDDDD